MTEMRWSPKVVVSRLAGALLVGLLAATGGCDGLLSGGLGALTDPGSEADEGTIESENPALKLALSDLVVGPADLVAGQPLTQLSFRATPAASTNSSAQELELTVEVLLSRNTTLSDEDDISLGKITATLPPDSAQPVTLSPTALATLKIPTDLDGQYYVFVRLQNGPSAIIDENEPSNQALSSTALVLHPAPRYVVAISEATWAEAAWQAVAQTLERKHGGTIMRFPSSPLSAAAVQELSALEPGYLAIVARPEEVTEQFVRDWHQVTRRLDSDPYGDTIWAVVTGISAVEAQRLAEAEGPLVTRRALLKTMPADWLNYFTDGTQHAGDNTKVMNTRTAGGAIVESRNSPTDDTAILAETLNRNDIDIFMTSGHASEFNLQLHYPNASPEGYLMASAGQLYGRDAAGGRHDITTTNPKIYYAPGNCLIGHIKDPSKSMALGWLSSGGAVQMAGYVVETWFGYMGWEISTYFFTGRHTFAESVFLNNQALLFDQQHKTAGRDPNGLAYDRDVFILYGDPAYDARTEGLKTPTYTQELSYTQLSPEQYQFTLNITLNEKTNHNKAVIARLPFRLDEPVVTDAAGRTVDVTDDMVLVQLWHSGQPELQAGQQWSITFTGRLHSAAAR